MFELGTDGPSLLLVAIDGSDTSMRAGAYAAGLARRQGSRVVCVYVGQITGVAAGVPSAVGALIQMHDSLARNLREQIEERAPDLGIHVTFVERRGDPYTEIVKVAEANGWQVFGLVGVVHAPTGRRFPGVPSAS